MIKVYVTGKTYAQKLQKKEKVKSMNTGSEYVRTEKSSGRLLSKLENLEFTPVTDIPADIEHGDMPGDKVEIEDIHIQKANTIFPELIKLVSKAIKDNPYERAVIAVCGGSGVGKSETASLLSFLFKSIGVGAYTLSGDNYPRRIPMYNDAERLHTFRVNAVRALADSGKYDENAAEMIKKLQQEERDSDEGLVSEYPFLKDYIEGGSRGLYDYLGTDKEIDFDEVNAIIAAFKDGAKEIWLKRMGRDECSLSYEKTDFSDKNILIIEWTHGNSDFLKGVDIPVLLNSTPEETLEHRRSRNRDGKIDSPFTTLVLKLEQRRLHSQAPKAKIILSKAGKLLTFEEYKEAMG